MTSSTGLRDRKKAATRAALSAAAVRLSRLHGLDAVTAEAIAAEADVSTRTFHNYFPSKEDAILYQAESSVQEWVNDLRARPAHEPIWDSLEALAIAYVSDDSRDLEDLSVVSRLVEQSPALMARTVQMHNTVSRLFGEAIADRTGTDIDSDLYPNLLQVAVGGAMKTVIELSISENAGGRTPEQLVSEAFALLRAGLPQPTHN
ncbi:TetR family transcriptional regulator [Antrihabitans sp. YC3-6]|uniref:TetR family transcriptional regulator n=1 Tax=Antrihabitans stalagmiti TaxID=2799499 RepID=A0A934NRK1_9NOCA|nr:TetR family transcriptional regulator [Antrihabitans stalagmiti]MBJ8340043.1 TetR family transcriptional regulator [Antrihabitans stalagmiti]